jgi:hypothetical protein
MAIRVRHPAWADQGVSLAVNGAPQPVDSAPGTYLSVLREWRDGDTIDLRLPMTLREEPLPGVPETIAILYGPVLLAGDLGTTGLTAAARYGSSAPPMSRVEPVEVPDLVTGDRRGLLAAIRPDPARPLTFRTVGLGRPRDVTLVPFHLAGATRYTVYWNVRSPAEWARRLAARAAEAARPRPAVVDSVDAGDPDDERAHAQQGERVTRPEFEGRLGRETRDGWFSYRLRVTPEAPVRLVCTYRGGEGRARVFDVIVDGQVIATETLAYHPTELRDVTYDVPDALTRGKQAVTVRFQPRPDAMTAWVFRVATARRSP